MIELTLRSLKRMQHMYVYAVLVFEAMATFVGQVSVLSLIALFGAATTAIVSQRLALSQTQRNYTMHMAQRVHKSILKYHGSTTHVELYMQTTTARKAVTLLLSYLIFTKPLTEQHVTGLLLIIMGIVIKLLPANRESGPRRQAKTTVQLSDDKQRGSSEVVEEEKTPLV